MLKPTDATIVSAAAGYFVVHAVYENGKFGITETVPVVAWEIYPETRPHKPVTVYPLHRNPDTANSFGVVFPDGRVWANGDVFPNVIKWLRVETFNLNRTSREVAEGKIS